LIFGKDPAADPHYDDTMHELHATTRQLEENVNRLEQAVEPYLDTKNPLIAMVITLLNEQTFTHIHEQQMRPDDDDAGT
jgi:hypothetical protein